MHIRTDMPTNAGVCCVRMPTYAVYICRRILWSDMPTYARRMLCRRANRRVLLPLSNSFTYAALALLMLCLFFTAGKHGKIERIGEFCFPFTDKHDQSDNMSRLLWVVRYLCFTYAYYMLYLCFAYALLCPLY